MRRAKGVDRGAMGAVAAEATGCGSIALLSPGQLRLFEERGVLTVDGPFSREEVVAMRDAFDAEPGILGWQPPQDEDDGRGNYRVITRPAAGDGSRLGDAIAAALRHPALEMAARQLMRAAAVSPNVAKGLGIAVCSMPEPAESPTAYSFHIDAQTTRHNWAASPRIGAGPAMWLWLSDVGPETAPLLVHHGSHLVFGDSWQRYDRERAARLPLGSIGISTNHQHEADEQARAALETALPLLQPAEPVLATAGQITFFTGTVLHRASPNRDTARRRVVILNFAPVAPEEYRTTRDTSRL